MSATQGLFGGGAAGDEEKAKAEDFISRYQTGKPSEGYSDQEAVEQLEQVPKWPRRSRCKRRSSSRLPICQRTSARSSTRCCRTARPARGWSISSAPATARKSPRAIPRAAIQRLTIARRSAGRRRAASRGGLGNPWRLLAAVLMIAEQWRRRSRRHPGRCARRGDGGATATPAASSSDGGKIPAAASAICSATFLKQPGWQGRAGRYGCVRHEGSPRRQEVAEPHFHRTFRGRRRMAPPALLFRSIFLGKPVPGGMRKC